MKYARFAIGFMLFTLLGANTTATASTNYFTEIFYGDFDLNGISMLFTPVGGDDYYEVQEVTAITELPVGTFGYPPIAPEYWWSSATILFNFPFYGTTYSAMRVTAQGYITFGDSDYRLGPSVSGHFSLPRISTYFAALDATAGGKFTIIGPWLDGSYTVTFEDVPSWQDHSRLCTFQCQLYPGGGIRMSWLNTSTSITALVGLSSGNGFPPDYQETDLSDYYIPPPSAYDIDGDGLPDLWEAFYFTHYTNCDPDGHGDSDGYDNESEYIAGTDPTDSSSYFNVDCSMGASQITLNWNSLTGRVYSIQHTRSLTSPFTNLVEGITPTPPMNSYASPIGQDSGFFKAGVEIAH